MNLKYGIMSTLKDLSSTSARETFNKKVLSAVPHLHPYVKHRIYIAESTGIIPKNMYSSNGIIDDCIIELYSNGYDIEAESNVIKLKLFKLVDEYLTTLFEKESFHKNTTSTNSILEDELSGLNEDFTMDADSDLILNTELNDISYHQHDRDPHIYLYSDKENSFLNAFEIEDLAKSKRPRVVHQFYSWLPVNISNIVDLYVFGHLTFDEIAQIKKQKATRIASIFEKVKKSFRTHLE
jgi:hypothetical protein